MSTKQAWAEIPQEQAAAIRLGDKAVVALKKHESVEQWHIVGIALKELQAAAMTLAGSDQPTGSRYNEAWKKLGESVPHLVTLEKSTRSRAMWLASEWPTVKAWLDELPNEKRWTLSHPGSIKRAYESATKAPQADKEAGSPKGLRAENVKLQEAADEAMEEVQTTREKMKRMIDLESWSPDEMGRMIVQAVPHKAQAISDAILKQLHIVAFENGGKATPPRRGRKPKAATLAA